MDARILPITLAALLPWIAIGCGTTKLQEATEQLVLSSAVDRSISMIDFRALADQRVYLDTTYLKNIKTPTFVNADYVTSALRQQIMAAGCYLQDEKDQADIIIEARIGTLGADDHRVTYGIPENNGLSSAASLIAQTPTPSIPEIAVARRDAREGAAKIAAFAYERETRTPIWQSGISQSIATSRNTWVMGVGPFQGGSIREGTHLAKGSHRGGASRPGASPSGTYERPVVEHTAEVRYDQGWPVTGKPLPDELVAQREGKGKPKKLPVPAAAPQSGGQADAMIADEPAAAEDDTLMR
ncbi:MAG: DUF6655 family protein [Planctomycetaceae bacterium]